VSSWKIHGAYLLLVPTRTCRAIKPLCTGSRTEAALATHICQCHVSIATSVGRCRLRNLKTPSPDRSEKKDSQPMMIVQSTNVLANDQVGVCILRGGNGGPGFDGRVVSLTGTGSESSFTSPLPLSTSSPTHISWVLTLRLAGDVGGLRSSEARVCSSFVAMDLSTSEADVTPSRGSGDCVSWVARETAADVDRGGNGGGRGGDDGDNCKFGPSESGRTSLLPSDRSPLA
jgi:hypothetical protein